MIVCGKIDRYPSEKSRFTTKFNSFVDIIDIYIYWLIPADFTTINGTIVRRHIISKVSVCKLIVCELIVSHNADKITLTRGILLNVPARSCTHLVQAEQRIPFVKVTIERLTKIDNFFRQ